MSSLWYVIETGIVGADGNEYVDDNIDESTDRDEQIEKYLGLDLGDLRKFVETEQDLAEGEVVFKRLTIERQSDPDNYIEKIVTIDFEDENSDRDPAVTTIEQLGDIDAFVEEAMTE